MIQTFLGYRRENGAVGVRNCVAVISVMDNCNPATRAIAQAVNGCIPITTLSTLTEASLEAFSATLTRELVWFETSDRSADVPRISLEALFNWSRLRRTWLSKSPT